MTDETKNATATTDQPAADLRTWSSTVNERVQEVQPKKPRRKQRPLELRRSFDMHRRTADGTNSHCETKCTKCPTNSEEGNNCTYHVPLLVNPVHALRHGRQHWHRHKDCDQQCRKLPSSALIVAWASATAATSNSFGQPLEPTHSFMPTL